MSIRRAFLLTASASAVTLGLSAPALAGPYFVHTCLTPAGQATGLAGWTVQQRGPGGVGSARCGDPVSGGLSAGLDENGPNAPGDLQAWRIDAPSGTVITGMNMEYSGGVGLQEGNDRPRLRFGTEAEDLFTIESGGGYDGGVGYPIADRRSLSLRAVCEGDSCRAQRPKAGFTIRRATVVLDDRAAPGLLGPATGTLTQPGPRRGVESLSFTARDDGGGLYRTLVEVDGRELARTVVDANGGQCADLGGFPSSEHDFPTTVPCRREAKVDLALDTARFGEDGEHTVVVRVQDAGGNVTEAYSGRVTTANGAGPNGTNATADARLAAGFGTSARRTRLRLRYGRRTTVAGRLTTADGRPIAGARLELSTRVAPAETFAPAGEVTTGADGGYRFLAPAGPSRVLRIGYRARSGDPALASAAEVELRVGVGVRMKPNRRRVRNRSSVTFRGRVLGAPAGSRKAVEVQAFDGGRWRPVGTTRIRRSGTFSLRYRFLRTRRTTTYRFRALVRKEVGFPYETGSSSVTRVRVRP